MSAEDIARLNYEAYLKLAMRVRDEMRTVTNVSLLDTARQAYEADQAQRIAEARTMLHMVWDDLLANCDVAGHA